MWQGGHFLHLHNFFFHSIFVFQLSGIACANCAQLPSLSLRTVPDRREKHDGVVNEIFLAQFSLFSKNGFESPISLSRAISKNRQIKKDSERLHEVAPVYPQHIFTATSLALTWDRLYRAETPSPSSANQESPWTRWASPELAMQPRDLGSTLHYFQLFHSREQLHWSFCEPEKRVPLAWD